MSDSTHIDVLGISGSLRKASFNTATLRAARELAPDGMRIHMKTLEDIPVYNEDLRAQGYPEPVQSLRDEIAGADALLIVTPEYNYSIPGVLKNAIDWASRPPDQPFDGKPIAIMGASPGRFGSARAQYHLRQCFVALNALVLNRPEVMVAGASALFDESGRLTDEATRAHIAKQLEALASWTRRLK
jgi:chromate reductase, NAD(P)H dehydrogenase (quinone)